MAIKTEMNGSMGGRWTLRAIAKQESKKARRANDKKAVKAAKEGR